MQTEACFVFSRYELKRDPLLHSFRSLLHLTSSVLSTHTNARHGSLAGMPSYRAETLCNSPPVTAPNARSDIC